MSIGIATLGMFNYQREFETGGGTYGYPEWEPKKPKIFVEKPTENVINKKIIIEVTDIKEG